MEIVYLLTDGHGYYKVGYSGRLVKFRRGENQTGNPIRLTVVFQFESSDNVALESFLKTQFNHRRTSGGEDWFKLNSEDLERLKSHVNDFENRECEVYGRETLIVRPVCGLELGRPRTNRQGVLEQKRLRCPPPNQPLFGTRSREHEIRRQDVPRKEGEADRDGDSERPGN